MAGYLQSSGVMICGLSLMATATAAMPGASTTPDAGGAGGSALDFLALVQSLECAPEDKQQNTRGQRVLADRPLIFGVLEESAAETEEKGGEEPRREQEATPMLLFLPTPAAMAPPPPPVNITLAMPGSSPADTRESDVAAGSTESHQAHQATFLTATADGAAVPEMPVRVPLPAPDESRFAVPGEDGTAREGSLAFAARVEKRMEAPVRPSDAEPVRAAPEVTAAERNSIASQKPLPPVPDSRQPAASEAMPAQVPNPVPVTDAEVPPPVQHPAHSATATEKRTRTGQPQAAEASAPETAPAARREPAPAAVDDGERRPAPVKAADTKSHEDTAKHGDREQPRTAREAEPGPAPVRHEPAAAPGPEALVQPGQPRSVAGESRAVPGHAAEAGPPVATVSAEAPDTRTNGAAHEISLKVSTPSASDVELKVIERAGEVQVAVRTPDRALAQSLREHLGDLTRALDDRGYQSETWQPAAAQASSSGDAARDSHSGGSAYENLRDGWAGQSGSGQHGGDGRRRQPQQPVWVEELQQQTGGEPPSEFRSYLK